MPSGRVTFLFTDLEGSTRLWEELGDAMKASLALHDEIMNRAVAGHGGHVFKHTGDGICAAFPSAAAAVQAAVEARSALASASWDGGRPLRARMGVHTGEAEETNGDYFGPAVNRAARVMAAGHGSQVLVSSTAYAEGSTHLDGIAFMDLGEHRLRDLSAPEHLLQAGEGEFPPLRTLEAVPNNLPAQLSTFVGREQELHAVKDLLDQHRLVTLTGVGGTGKTRLALQTAADLVPRFPDGVYLVELASVTDPAVVGERVATSISSPSLQGDMGTNRTAGERLVDRLGEHRVLLVLDNCEHLVDTAARLTEEVLQRCANVHVLATSREALGIAGEQSWRVPSLSMPASDRDVTVEDLLASESGSLLVDRARAADPSFAVTPSTASAVAEICRRLDGIPLALELAAARISALSPQDVLERLDDQFRLLTGGSRTAVERHQTLRAAIDWSFDLLSGPARRLLPRLAVFSGGWTLAGAESACASVGLDEVDVLDALTELVEKSLVTAERGEEATRYGMVEPVRQYALEKLRDAGEVIEQRDRHAGWVVEHTATTLWNEMTDMSVSVPRIAFATLEYANTVEAIRWLVERKDGESAMRVLGGAGLVFLLNGNYREGLQLIDRTLELGAGVPEARHWQLTYSVYLTLWVGDEDDAWDRLEVAGKMSPEVGGRTTYFVTLARATILLTTGGLEEISTELAEAYEQGHASGDHLLANYATFLLGLQDQLAGEYERSIGRLEEAYRSMGAIPVAWVPYALPNRALAKVLAGHPDAGEAVDEGEASARESGDPAAIITALNARVWHAGPEEARSALQEITELVRRVGLRINFFLSAPAIHAERLGRPDFAAHALGVYAAHSAGRVPAYMADLEARCRAAIGDETWEAHEAVGRRMSPLEVLEDALALPLQGQDAQVESLD